MREIIFRGRTETDLWIEGDLRQYPTGTKAIRCDALGHTVPVAPETVGQYTGMKDKNGIRIFEGDIVECWSEGVKAQGAVQQRQDGLWIIYPAWQKSIMWGLCQDEYGHTSVEVIGNIHHYDPELMGV